MTDKFSGKYYFHSLYKNVGAYIREPGLVGNYSSRQFFLVHDNDKWWITDDEEKNGWGQKVDGGYFRNSSKGKFCFSRFKKIKNATLFKSGLLVRPRTGTTSYWYDLVLLKIVVPRTRSYPY